MYIYIDIDILDLHIGPGFLDHKVSKKAFALYALVELCSG